MKTLLLSLLTVVLLTAVMGWLTHLAHARAGKPGQKLLRGFLGIGFASLLIFLMFIANYWLASTALGRIWGQEPLGSDPVLRSVAGSSSSNSGNATFNSLTNSNATTGLKSNHIIALVLVLGSFLCCAWLLKCLGKSVALLRSGGWRRSPVDAFLTLAQLGVAAFITYRILHTDVTLLMFRSAQMMFSDKFDGGASAIPDFDHLVAQFPNTMAAALLLSLFWWYPLLILLVEKHWATCWGAFSEALDEYHNSYPPMASVVQSINPVPVAMPPIVVHPRAEPTLPTAPAPDPVVVMPSTNGFPTAPGAAPWVRPAPFNIGPTPSDNQTN